MRVHHCFGRMPQHVQHPHAQHDPRDETKGQLHPAVGQGKPTWNEPTKHRDDENDATVEKESCKHRHAKGPPERKIS